MFTELSIFLLLIVSKLSSTFINISPFLAVIVIGSYFIHSKYRLLLMIFAVQLFSDLVYGLHVSNLSVYLSYLIIVLIIYRSEIIYSLTKSMLHGLQANVIFFIVSNFGHYLAYNSEYTLSLIAETYSQGLYYGINLLLSTVIFIIIFHALLAVSRKQLVKSRSTR
mgnify:FL=1